MTKPRPSFAWIAWSRRLWPALLVALPLAILTFKLRHFVTAQEIMGWDTVGHRHLADVNRALLAGFDSMGYDTTWFQGFAAFYFYPPFLYFLFSNVSLLTGASTAWVFNLGLFAVMLFMTYALARFTLVFAAEQSPERRMLAVSLALLIYLLYPGEGLQGTGLVGFLGGTIVSTFGHGLLLLGLSNLELYRRTRSWPDGARAILVVAVLLYSHYLSAVFFCIAATVYLVMHRREFHLREVGALLVVPIVAALPILVTFLSYRRFSSGTPYVAYYPALLSILGTDLHRAVNAGFGATLKALLFDLQFVQMLVAGLLGFGFVRGLARGLARPQRFLVLMGGLFLLLALDTSISYLLPWLGAHWYRTFDGFWICAAVFAAFTALELGDLLPVHLRRPALIGGVLLLSLRFVFWDPVEHFGYPARDLQFFAGGQKSSSELNQMETALRRLPPGRLIWAELVRGRKFHGTPHALDVLLRRSGHRSVTGLTIESSLTPLLTSAHAGRDWPHLFVWGIETNWRRELPAHLNPSSPLVRRGLRDYLRRAGVQYVLGRTERMRRYLTFHKEDFAPVARGRYVFLFRVRHADPGGPIARLPSRPVAMVYLDQLQAPHRGAKRERAFLLHSNQLRLRGVFSDRAIVNLWTGGRQSNSVRLDPRLWSGLIVFHRGKGLAGSHEVGALLNGGLPLVLVNFRRTTKSRPNVQYVYTTLRVPPRKSPSAGTRTQHGRPTARVGGTPPAGTQERSENGVLRRIFFAHSGPGCAAHVVRLSYFPDWKMSDGSPVYQTDTNHMLVCARSGAQLRFRAWMSRPATLIMYVLLLLSLGLTAFQVYRWARNNRGR